MALVRPIGKATKIACFEKEITEGVYVNPTKEYPFKSCDVKKTMKTEEDASNIGEVFTTDLITMGYDVTGNIEMNVYPETVKNILYFTLGKIDETTFNAIKGVLTIKYIGTQQGCRYSVYDNAGDLSLRVETYNGATWSALFDIVIETLTLAQIKIAIEGVTTDLLVYVEGVGVGSDLEMVSEKVIKSDSDNVLGLLFAYKLSSSKKSKRVWGSNSVLDGIPSFSMLVDKLYGANKCFGYAGCKINTLSLSLAVKTFVTASLSLRAKEEYNDKTDTSTDFTMTNPFVTNNSKIVLNGVEFSDIKDLKLDINNNMYIDESVGVNTYNSQDRQGATINISGSANLTIEDGNRQVTQVLNDNYINNAPIDILIILNSNLKIEDDIYNKVYIYLSKVKLSDGTTSIGGAERLTLSFSGQAVKCSLTDRHIDVYLNDKT
ncbi:MAG: hypothetical protein GYA14_13820 [Ignavibacteria bacterium]|nr:hypothetical protein [Ignavibacteria bacterium]